MKNNWRNRKHHEINPLAVIGIIIAVFSAIYIIRNRDELKLSGSDEVHELSNYNVVDKDDTNVIQNLSKESLYDEICEQINQYKTSITISSGIEYNTTIISETFSKAVYDNPEWFWLTGGCNIQGITVGNLTTYTISIDYICTMSEIPRMAQQLDDIVVEIVDKVEKNCQSDYEKAKQVHDIIVLNCEYDIDAYNATIINPNSGMKLAHTVYGCLVEGKAVCEGYAKAYMYIMNRLGIECGYVTGTGTDITSNSSGLHGWNYINLEGDYYMVDVTWDDPLGAPADYCGYDYFCVTTEDILLDHTIDSSIDVPYCSGGKYLQ